MTKDEALELALEALEDWCCGFPDLIQDMDTQAIAAIKEVLAQTQEPKIKTTDPFESSRVADYNRGWNDCIFASGIVKQTEPDPVAWEQFYPDIGKPKFVAQPEPVAWMCQHEETGRTVCIDAQQLGWGFEKGNPRLKKIAPLYTTPPQRTERPVDCERCNRLEEQAYDLVGKLRVANIKLSMQPQRTWVGLTYEEITELHHEIKVWLMGTYKTEDIYRAIEAKLRSKNNG